MISQVLSALKCLSEDCSNLGATGIWSWVIFAVGVTIDTTVRYSYGLASWQTFSNLSPALVGENVGNRNSPTVLMDLYVNTTKL